ncbi:hypothetical protein Dimus_038795 [Dionaea muscipula]
MIFEPMLSSRSKEASKRDKGLALKSSTTATEESDSEDEELALMTRIFKKFFKQARGKRDSNNKGKSFSKNQTSTDGCFKCVKTGHMINDCPNWSKEREKEHRPKKQFASLRKEFKKVMIAAWGDTDEEDSDDQQDTANLSLMAMSDSDSEYASEQPEALVTGSNLWYLDSG